MVILKESAKKLLEALEAHTKLLAFIFGLCFVGILLALAVWFPQPTAFQYTVFRIALALAAAGVAGVIPGMIRLKFQPNTMLLIHAGGALAVFVIVYFIAPAALRSELPAPTGQQNNGGVNQTINNSQIGTINNTVNHYGLTKEQYEEGQKKLLNDLAAKLPNADAGQRALLERQLQDVQTRLADINKSYEKSNKLLKEIEGILEQAGDQQPVDQVKKAEDSLKYGDTKEAEQILNAMVEKGGRGGALAAYQSGQIAESRLDYEKALYLYKKAVMIEQDNPEYLRAAGRMAWTFADYQQAENYLKQLIQIRENDHNEIELARSQHELASLYEDIGKYNEAELLFNSSLAVEEKILGNEHRDVGATLNNLANIYREQGKYEKAELLYKRSIAIIEKRFGKNHPDAGMILSSLVLLYKLQGKYEEAEPLGERSLAILEDAFGKNHPKIKGILNNLALIYKMQGKYAKAETLYHRSLSINESVFGKNHPDLARILNNLSGLYYEQGRYVEAEQFCQRALAIREKALGKNHPDVANSLNNLASLYYNQDKHIEAEMLYKRALVIYENALSKDHPDIASTLNNLAELYKAQHRNNEAEPLYKRALSIMEVKFPNGHPDIQGIQENYDALKRKMAEQSK